MASIQSREGICNLAMTMLGGSLVSSLTVPTGDLAKRLALVYPTTLKAELRKRRWNFAKVVHQLSRDAGYTGSNPRAYRYAFPPSVERIIVDRCSDWLILGNYIYTDESPALLEILAIDSDVPVGNYDSLFVPALAAAIALQMAEHVTQSNSKKADAEKAYRTAIAAAGRANSFEKNEPDLAPRGSWAEALGG